MSADLKVECQGEELILCKERAIYWTAQTTLVISDLHIGKSAFFRRNGVPVPGTVGQTDLQRLGLLIEGYKPEKLVITGDMFHHNMNSDVEVFKEWRGRFTELTVQLIKGNHDRLKNSELENLGIEVYQHAMLSGPFRFIHDKPKITDGYYNISGHIHPGILINGRAKQTLKFPCFYFSDTCAVLPAFSTFTGLYILEPKKGDRFYAITPEKVVRLPS